MRRNQRRDDAPACVRVIVLAKAPMPGRSKTRLTPPCTPADAAAIAQAALEDTLRAAEQASDSPMPRLSPMLALDGPAGDWLPPGIAVVAQAPGSLSERIAAAFDAAGGPALLIGMDTPQISPACLRSAAAALTTPGCDAVLGPAEDGGWWCLGLRRPEPRITRSITRGVAMSTAQTGDAQHLRLHALGLRHSFLPSMRDVDTFDDALAVAALAPGTRFAATTARVRERIGHAAAPVA